MEDDKKHTPQSALFNIHFHIKNDGSFCGEDYTTTDTKTFQYTTSAKAKKALWVFLTTNGYTNQPYKFGKCNQWLCESCRHGEHIIRQPIGQPRKFTVRDCATMVDEQADVFITDRLTLSFGGPDPLGGEGRLAGFGL